MTTTNPFDKNFDWSKAPLIQGGGMGRPTTISWKDGFFALDQTQLLDVPIVEFVSIDPMLFLHPTLVRRIRKRKLHKQ